MKDCHKFNVSPSLLNFFWTFLYLFLYLSFDFFSFYTLHLDQGAVHASRIWTRCFFCVVWAELEGESENRRLHKFSFETSQKNEVMKTFMKALWLCFQLFSGQSCRGPCKPRKGTN